MTPAGGDLFPPPAAAAADSIEPAVRDLLELYLPLCRGCPERFVVAHLGQSLDGRIAAANGASRWVTGDARRRAQPPHAGVVRCGRGRRRHGAARRPAADRPRGAGCRARCAWCWTPGGASAPATGCSTMARRRPCCCAPRGWRDPASASGRPRWWASRPRSGSLSPRAVLDRLAARGLARVFIEGGGLTVSRFLAAGCLHRLQITVAPLIIGSGRPEHHLARDRAAAAPACGPRCGAIVLGSDVLFDCRLDG